MGDYTLVFLSVTTVFWIPLLHLSEGIGNSKGYYRYTVIPKPVFNNTPTNVTTPLGEIAVLKCCIVNMGTKTVTWRRANQKHPLTVGRLTFVGDTRISVVHRRRSDHVDEWNLVIRSVKKDDMDTYECQVSTRAMMKRNYHLTVVNSKRPPRMMVSVVGAKYIGNGSQIYLLCNATGHDKAPYDVTWLKNGEEVNSNARTGILITKRIIRNSLISIYSLEKGSVKDSGKYECVVDDRNRGSLLVSVLGGTARIPKRLEGKDSSAVISNPSALILFSAILTFVLPKYFSTV